MPTAATPETAPPDQVYMRDYVLMQSPTGETRRVSAKPEAIIPLMINGWKQVEQEGGEV